MVLYAPYDAPTSPEYQRTVTNADELDFPVFKGVGRGGECR